MGPKNIPNHTGTFGQSRFTLCFFKYVPYKFLYLQLEIFCLFQKTCRELFCPFPTTPFYGTCISLSKNVFGLAVHIHFKLTVLGRRTASKVNATTSETGQAVHDAFSKSIGFKRAKCPTCLMLVMRQSETVATHLQFYILVTVCTTSHCQYDRITELVSAILANEIKIIMPDKSAVLVRVSIDRRTYIEIQSAAEFMYVGGTITCGRLAAEHQVKNGLFCPQVEINRSEMSAFVERSGKSQRLLFDEGKIDDISNGSIRICEKEYFATAAQTNCAFRLFRTGGGAIGCCLLFVFIL